MFSFFSKSYKWNIAKGCIPCSFVCDCCDEHYYRCGGMEDMYYYGDSYRPLKILCGTCYGICLYKDGPCDLHERNRPRKHEIWINGLVNKDGLFWTIIYPKEKIITRGSSPIKYEGELNTLKERAKLLAVVRAIIKYGSDLTINTDSNYLIKCFTQYYKIWLENGWKNLSGRPVKHQKLLKYALELGADKVKWIRSKKCQYREMSKHHSRESVLREQNNGWTIINY